MLAGEADAAHACGAGLPPGGAVTITFAEHADGTTLRTYP